MALPRGTSIAFARETGRLDSSSPPTKYPGAFEGIVRQALTHVSAIAKLSADVVATLDGEASAVDPATIAPIERDHEAALDAYRPRSGPGDPRDDDAST